MADDVHMFTDTTRTKLTRSLKGYGQYHEKYRRCSDGRWRIQQVRLHRLRVDIS